jgi:hypothetical protein
VRILELNRSFHPYDRSSDDRARRLRPADHPGEHSRFLPPIETRVKGLCSAWLAQINPEDRGQNYAVRIGLPAAQLLIDRHA